MRCCASAARTWNRAGIQCIAVAVAVAGAGADARLVVRRGCGGGGGPGAIVGVEERGAGVAVVGESGARRELSWRRDVRREGGGADLEDMVGDCGAGKDGKVGGLGLSGINAVWRG